MALQQALKSQVATALGSSSAPVPLGRWLAEDRQILIFDPRGDGRVAEVFGDLDDPNSEVSILIKTHRAEVLHPELGNKPKVYYLAPR